jgi:hypothetical protein
VSVWLEWRPDLTSSMSLRGADQEIDYDDNRFFYISTASAVDNDGDDDGDNEDDDDDNSSRRYGGNAFRVLDSWL